jgi:hypothetical protein
MMGNGTGRDGKTGKGDFPKFPVFSRSFPSCVILHYFPNLKGIFIKLGSYSRSFFMFQRKNQLFSESSVSLGDI